MTITQLYTMYRQRLYRWGIKRGFSPADAEEMVSETFTRALTKGITTGRGLELIHSGQMMDSRRGNQSATIKAERPVGLDVSLRGGQSYVTPTPACEVDDLLLAADLVCALKTCPRENAEAFALHYLNGLTYDEIGQRLGLSRQRIHQRAERARLRIIEEVAA